MLRAPEQELCQECHPGEAADGLLPSHHPIREGKMSCTDCHNVHGDERGNLPGASTAEMCYKCHGEKEGPYVYEHPPVTEDCATCHRPHGSPNDNLLVQEQPLLCLQCHPGHHDGHRSPLISLDPTAEGVANAQAGIQGFYAKCTSCHSRIHGTDLPSGTRNGTFMPGAPIEVEASGASVAAASMDPGYWGFSEVEFGQFDGENNQTYVREYDGRDYDVPAPRIDVLRFGQRDDLSLQVTDLARGDEEVALRFGNSNYDVQVLQSSLTHRLSRSSEMYTASPLDIAGNAIEVTDESGGTNDYEIDRTVLDVRLAARCPTMPHVKWMLNQWQESEHGSRQFLYLERCESCHKIQTTEPIDRRTTVIEGGVEVSFATGAVRYMRQERKFSNRAAEAYNDFPGSRSVYGGSAPLFGVASTKTTGNDVRGAAQLSSGLSAAALWRSKEREDRLGNGSIDVRSSGGGVAWRGSPDLTVSGSFVGRSFDVENVINGVSRDRDTSQVSVRYTGLPGSALTVGYAKERVDRDFVGDAHVPLESDSNIWRASLISRLSPRARVQVRYRATETDTEGFFDVASPPEHFPSRLLGPPQDGRTLSGVLTYSVSPRTVLSGMHSRQDNTYEVSVPSLGVAREARDDRRTTGAQVTHSTKGRARVSASYYRQSGSTGSNATYGADDYTMEPPEIAVETDFPPLEGSTALDYDASTANLDVSKWVTSRVRLFGRYSRTETDGQHIAYELGNYLDQDPDADGVAVTFHPFDIGIVDSWVGISYLLDSSTEVALSRQHRSWDNAADPTQDGTYDIWRLGLRKGF